MQSLLIDRSIGIVNESRFKSDSTINVLIKNIREPITQETLHDKFYIYHNVSENEMSKLEMELRSPNKGTWWYGRLNDLYDFLRCINFSIFYDFDYLYILMEEPDSDILKASKCLKGLLCSLAYGEWYVRDGSKAPHKKILFVSYEDLSDQLKSCEPAFLARVVEFKGTNEFIRL